MQVLLHSNPAFRHTAALWPLAALPGMHHLQITSTFAKAKRPEQQRVVFALTLDRAGLLALRGLIEAELSS